MTGQSPRLRAEKTLAAPGTYVDYFYEKTVSLLSYLPEDTLLCFDETHFAQFRRNPLRPCAGRSQYQRAVIVFLQKLQFLTE